MMFTKKTAIIAIIITGLSVLMYLWTTSTHRPDLAEKVHAIAHGAKGYLILPEVVHDVPWDRVMIFGPYSVIPDHVKRQRVSSDIKWSDSFTLWVFLNTDKVTAWFELPRTSDVTKNVTLFRSQANIQFKILSDGRAQFDPH